MKNHFFIFCSILLVTLFAQCSKDSQVTNPSNTSGKAGSLARFAIVGNYLYAVNNQSLMVFDVANPKNIISKQTINLGENIETIFPFQGKLFIASNSGMYMYNISNPTLPVKESFVQHITGCDPVVANTTHAYLTIHSGNRCGMFSVNELQVYKLDNISNPILVNRILLSNPVGLGLKDDYLFVCDKVKGLMVYDITDGDNPSEKQIITDETFVDVIVYDNLLICMLENGIAYYDISDLNNITKLSVLN